MTTQVHTVPNPAGDGWVNEVVVGSSTSVEGPPHATKDQAVSAGRALARTRFAEHFVHNADGTIAYRNSYGGDDPRKPG